MQSVLPYHRPRFTPIIDDAKKERDAVRPYDLSFCTHFIVAMLFLDVKASRPMTYQLLTIEMVQSIKRMRDREESSTRASSKQASATDSTR